MDYEQVGEVAKIALEKTACANCGAYMYYKASDMAEGDGHCYSYNGVQEALWLSGFCEYCFDSEFLDPHDDPVFYDDIAIGWLE